MNGFETYKMYVALKNHFTSATYDYFRYSGKTRASLKTYDTRKDKYFFEKLGRKRNVEQFILANIIADGASNERTFDTTASTISLVLSTVNSPESASWEAPGG